jgi:hypothetical protein
MEVEKIADEVVERCRSENPHGVFLHQVLEPDVVSVTLVFSAIKTVPSQVATDLLLRYGAQITYGKELRIRIGAQHTLYRTNRQHITLCVCGLLWCWVLFVWATGVWDPVSEICYDLIHSTLTGAP